MLTMLFLRSGNFTATTFYACVSFSFLCLDLSAVRTTTTRYPSPSLMHLSAPSFNTVEDMTGDYILADGKDYWTARRKVRVPIHYAFPVFTPD